MRATRQSNKGIIAAGNDGASERQALQRHRRKIAHAVGSMLGGIDVAGRNQQRGTHFAAMEIHSPMGHQCHAEAMRNQNTFGGRPLHGLLQSMQPFIFSRIFPVTLLDSKRIRQRLLPQALPVRRA